MELRLATVADAEAIRAIYNLEVETSTVTLDLVPRSLEDQQAYLARRAGTYAVLVAVEDKAVIGFGSLSPYRDRPGYNATAEDSIYIHRDHQGRGDRASEQVRSQRHQNFLHAAVVSRSIAGAAWAVVRRHWSRAATVMPSARPALSAARS